MYYLVLVVFSEGFACTGEVMTPKRIIGSGQLLWQFVCGAKGRRINFCRCCWLATKPFSDYDMIETQVMVTPKTKKKNGVPPSVDVNRMHLEYKWELPINHGTDMSKKVEG